MKEKGEDLPQKQQKKRNKNGVFSQKEKKETRNLDYINGHKAPLLALL